MVCVVVLEGKKKVMGSDGRTKEKEKGREGDQPKERKVVVGWLVGCLWMCEGEEEERRREEEGGVNKNEKKIKKGTVSESE